MHHPFIWKALPTGHPSESDRPGTCQSREAPALRCFRHPVTVSRRAEDDRQPRFSNRRHFAGGLSPLLRIRHSFPQAGEVFEPTSLEGHTWTYSILPRRRVACCALLVPAIISGTGLYPPSGSPLKSPLTWTPILSLAPNSRRSLSKRSG